MIKNSQNNNNDKELYDLLDEEGINNYNDYQNKKDNQDNINMELPTVEINDEEEYLADTYNDDIEEQKDKEFDEKMKEPYVPPEIDEDVPEFANNIQAIQWAIDNNKVLKIDYTTINGKNIRRYIEPHLIFNAKSGNLIVVTYDRSVRDIRAFIINNIINYDVTGKEFKQRMRIIPKIGKGTNNMSNIHENLNNVAEELEKNGLKKSSSIVREPRYAPVY